VIARWLAAASIVVALTLGLSPASSQEENKAPAQEAIEVCRMTADRIGRLACFDRLFATPIAIAAPKTLQAAPAESAASVVRRLALTQEEMRRPGQADWLLRLKAWNDDAYFPIESISDLDRRRSEIAAQKPGWTLEASDLFLTMREADVAERAAPVRLEEQAVLMISCENDITTLYFTLPRPVSDARTQVAVSSDRGAPLTLRWRDFESGDVILAGRGLESIDVLNTLVTFKRIQLQVKYDDGPRAFVFDIGDLGEKLRPLRQACHW
jgi:type VI secretion system protein VasI